MKTKLQVVTLARRATTSLVLLSLTGLLTFAAMNVQAASLSELLEQGVYSEETKGDLDAALKAYQQVVADAKAGEALAAQAQYRLGAVYYKQKNYAQATAAFEKLVKDYPDQKDLVTRANEYLAGAVALLPAPWGDAEVLHLDLKFSSGFKAGSATYAVEAAERDGRKIWRVSSQMNVGVQQASRVDVEANSFQPIHSRWRHTLLGDAVGNYSPGQVEVRWQGQSEPKTVALNGVHYDNEEVIQFVRRLPLATDYSTTIRILSTLGGASIIPIQFTVVKVENVEVPAGTFECFRINLSLVNQTFWYSTDEHHYLVKFEGGGVNAELRKIETDAANDFFKQGDAIFDFPLANKAGGGVPTVEPATSQPLQNQAKLLMLATSSHSKLPAAANWCESLNAGNTRQPAVPADTVFALNAQVAGLERTKLSPNTVVFFETATPGLNQSGGVELLAKKAAGVAIAFADGRALLVSPDEVATLRWEP
jgi:tetratricopeptide (TPR) repeat protein